MTSSQRNRRFVFWLLPLAILAGAAVYLWSRWDAIPALYPIHFGRGGAPDDWAARTPLAVGMPLIIAAILDFIILGASVSYSRRAGRMRSGKAQQLGRELETMAAVIACFVALMGALIAATTPFMGESRRLLGLLVLCSILGSLAMMVGLFLLVVKVDDAMGEERRLALADGTLSPEVDRARRDPKFWKWGVFYYNPADPALWVEKLYGAGWTTNMARRAAWWWLGGFGAFVLLILGFVIWRVMLG